MIVLDTNVVSEMMKERPDPKVLRWLDGQIVDQMYLTAINLAELLIGMELMPSGRRRQALETTLSQILGQYFPDRILPFDEPAARTYSLLLSHARGAGRPISVADGQIAAIAKLHGFTVATRDTGPFAAAGVAFVNPWELA